jgi:hypothetical protein
MGQSILGIEGKRAVLAGINKYVDESVRALQYSVNDVKALCDILTDNNRGAFEKENVKLLVDDPDETNKPIRSNLMSAVKSLSECASDKDSILFYFSGHGIEQEGKSYLLPMDSRINVLGDTAIPITWIKETLAKSNARAKILILDACHAGALLGKAGSGQMTKGFNDTLFSPAEGMAILSSCKFNEVSYEWDEKTHGVFSYYLTEGLLGHADLDSDGVVTISEINRYVSEKVKSWAFRSGVQQNPTLQYNVSGDLILANVPGQVMRNEPIVAEGKSPKQYVELIALMPDVRRLEIGEACGFLLSYYKTSEIKELSEHEYGFPDGKILTEMIGARSRVRQINFIYRPENWAIVDPLINGFAKSFSLTEVSYFVRAKLDGEKLVEHCKQSRMKIKGWRPRTPFYIEVSADGWGREGLPALATFSNLKDGGSSITIKQFIDEEVYDGHELVLEKKALLEPDFYSRLNPENIISFIAPCLVTLTDDEKNRFEKLIQET